MGWGQTVPNSLSEGDYANYYAKIMPNDASLPTLLQPSASWCSCTCNASTFAHMCTSTHTHTQIHPHQHMHTQTQTHKHTHIHMYNTHANTQLHTSAHTQVQHTQHISAGILAPAHEGVPCHPLLQAFGAGQLLRNAPRSGACHCQSQPLPVCPFFSLTVSLLNLLKRGFDVAAVKHPRDGFPLCVLSGVIVRLNM